MHQQDSGRKGCRHEKEVGGEECGVGDMLFFLQSKMQVREQGDNKRYGFLYRIGLVDPRGPFTAGGKQTRTSTHHTRK